MFSTIHDHCMQVAAAAVDRVDPRRMITRMVQLEGDQLTIRAEDKHKRIDLSHFNRIVVIGAGKAGAKMAQGIEDVLGERIAAGLVVVKTGHTETLTRIEPAEAGHPVPDQAGVEVTGRIIDLAASADEATLVINLISGGGSALLTRPAEGLTLAMLRQTTQALLNCGAGIQEINCIRKHVSAVKGGRLARVIFPATTISFILSDVIGDKLADIASGPTVPDESTFTQALQIVKRYGIQSELPAEVYRHLRRGRDGEIEESPPSGDKVFQKTHNILVGTNLAACRAGAAKAEELGYFTLIVSSQIQGEAREIAKFYAALVKDWRRLAALNSKILNPEIGTNSVCLIAGGETTVSIRGQGRGGRNQEMALAFLNEIAANPSAFDHTVFLSAASDGNDGPTDAAGAFASPEVLTAAREQELDIEAYLENNDSYPFFATIGGLYKTGPTNTNVCDLQICIIR